jgi:hypothetical protein
MKPRARLKWDKFICRIFDHKWHCSPEEAEKLDSVGWALFVCRRCAGTKSVWGGPPILIPDDGITGPLIFNDGFEIWSDEPPSDWLK